MGQQAELHAFKVPVVIRQTFTLSFEQSLGFTFIHCDIHGSWTPKIKRELQSAFGQLRVLHGQTIFAQHDPEDHKHEKFLKMFGFSFDAEFAAPSTGAIRHLYSIR